MLSRTPLKLELAVLIRWKLPGFFQISREISN
ncbi:hypothetical protein T11_11118 [Trichinella zimbabwensis]|uniref:Uncharacterized protein n=1 Tax=Trichinella zimbabwensis TaxID=268475 RepID=A0A0V1GCM3_9BILA|nr:hypothetical protein T11_11118 [Trichinella zimbabwensis]